MEDINKLRAKRTNIKGQLTQFAKFVRDLGGKQRAQLPDKIRHAEELYNSYNETQSQIAKLKIEILLGKTPASTPEGLQTLETELARERCHQSKMFTSSIFRKQNSSYVQKR